VRADAEGFERAPSGAYGRLERLALDHLDAEQLELVPVRDVPRPCHDRDVREVPARNANERQARFDVVDRVHEHARAGGARRLEQVAARGVAVEDAEAEVPEDLDVVGIVVEDGRAKAAREEQAADDLPEAAEAREDDRGVLALDGVVGPLVPGARCAGRSRRRPAR
jgi:hypothetical protein